MQNDLTRDTNAVVTIEYCTQCRWVTRATWLTQELLLTFGNDLAELTLRPGTGGIFKVFIGQQLIFDRAEHGRFPEPKELKQGIRDVIDPTRDLGHSDCK